MKQFLLDSENNMCISYSETLLLRKTTVNSQRSPKALRQVRLRTCNREEPYGTFSGQTPPSYPWFRSFLKCLDDSIDAHNLSCFTDAKTTIKEKKLTTWWSWAHSPQTYGHLSNDNVKLCNAALLLHHQPIRELHKLVTYLGAPVPYLVLKNALLKPI